MYSSQLHKGSSLFGMSNLYHSNDPSIIQIDYVISPTLLVPPKSSQKDQVQVQVQEEEDHQEKMESQSEDHEVNIITLPSHKPSPCSSSSQDHDATKKYEEDEVIKPKVATTTTTTTYSNCEDQDTTSINFTMPPSSFPSSSSSSSSSPCSQHHDETKDKEDEVVKPTTATCFSKGNVKCSHPVLLKREFNETFLEIEDGYQTPPSPSHRIPRVMECPPAPRKVYCRRRVMNKRYIEFVSVGEIGDNFSPMRKKARGESAIAN